MDNPNTVDRRKFLGALGVTVGGTGLAGAGLVAGPQLVKAAAEPPKGKIPGYAVQDRPHDLPDRPGRRAR